MEDCILLIDTLSADEVSHWVIPVRIIEERLMIVIDNLTLVGSCVDMNYWFDDDMIVFLSKLYNIEHRLDNMGPFMRKITIEEDEYEEPEWTEYDAGDSYDLNKDTRIVKVRTFSTINIDKRYTNDIKVH